MLKKTLSIVAMAAVLGSSLYGADAKKTNNLFEKVEVTEKDGFGDVKKTKKCKIFLVEDETEIAEYFAQTWKNPKLFSTEYKHDPLNIIYATSAASVDFDFYGSIDFNQMNIQGESYNLKSNLSQKAIYLSLHYFCLEDKLKKKHIQLLQAYLAANGLVTANKDCRYWPLSARDIPVDIFGTLMQHKNAGKKQVVLKLFAILAGDKTEEEKIQMIMKQPKVKEMFEIISK